VSSRRLGPSVHHITASDGNGQEFAVEVQRDFRFDPYRDILVCSHCEWTRYPLSFRKSAVDFASEHLSEVHGADEGIHHHKDESFGKFQRIMLPFAAIAVLVILITVLK
jgi:hypothetical protein